MYTVYKITNKINNKCYIGSSICVEKRWKQHINTSNNSNSSQYKYPLYCAFRKYGIENFSFEVIKDDFENPLEMQLFEKDMIIYYDSVNSGYNQTYYTDRYNIAKENLNKYQLQISQKCALVDKDQNILEIYNSYHDAARKQGQKENQDWASNIRRVCKGEYGNFQGKIFRDLDENNNVIKKDIKRFRGKKQVIGINVEDPCKNLYFESISEASNKMSIPRKSISDCVNGSVRYSIVHNYIWREIDIFGDIIKNNIDIEEKILEYNNKNPVINGIRHNIPEWCKIYNIKPATVRARIRKGMDPVKALQTPVKGR